MSRKPRWIGRLFNYCLDAFDYDEPQVLFGGDYRAPDPTDAEAWWSLVIFPTRIEMYGGATDGRIVRPRLHVLVSHLMKAFDAPPRVDWDIPARCTGMIGGPRLTLSGPIRKRLVILTIFDRAPKNHPIRTLFDTRTGDCRMTEDKHVG